MMFQSVIFLCFFALVCLAYWVMPAFLRKYWLLAASYVFYVSFVPSMVIYLAAITAFSWGMSHLVARQRQKGERQGKWMLAAAIVGTVSVLAVVKYAGFALETINRVFIVLRRTPPMPALKLAQPIGISFFTFSAVGYLVDVYRGKREAEKNFLHYALYLSFFPTILSGPVERSTNLLRQIDESRSIRLDTRKIRHGLLTMLYGYFLKLVCADRLNVMVNSVFADPASQAGCVILLGVMAYGIQLYCDFAGLSNIAIGAGEVLGFSLMENFKAPYLATSISDFWRRWHISLTSWFREYIYFPLGGNRKGKLRRHFNVMAIFLISGLWHGAGWTYIFWGGLNGLYMVLGDVLRPLRAKITQKLSINPDNGGNRFFRRMFTFFLVTFSWLFFRAEMMSQAITMLTRIVTAWNPWVLWEGALLNLGLTMGDWWILAIALLAVLLLSLADEHGMNWRSRLLDQGYAFRLLVYMALLFAVLLFGMYGASFDSASFIYVDF